MCLVAKDYFFEKPTPNKIKFQKSMQKFSKQSLTKDYEKTQHCSLL